MIITTIESLSMIITTMSSVNGHNGEASLSMIITTIYLSMTITAIAELSMNDHNGDKIY